jgi:DNA-binding CsgD family transcriptional regulator
MPTEDAVQKLQKLSSRERQVLGLVCDGFSYKDIAAKLYISVPTVKTDMGRVYDKLELDQLDKAARIREIHQVYCPLMKDYGVSPEPMSPKPIPSEPVSPEPVPSEPLPHEQVPPEPKPSEKDEPVPMEIMKMVEEDEPPPPPQPEVIYIPQIPALPPGKRHRRLVVGIVVGVLACVCLVAGIFLVSQLFPKSNSPSVNAPPIMATEGVLPTSPQSIPTSAPIQQPQVVATNPPEPTTPILPTIALPFSDNFDSGLSPAWQVLSGNWLTSNGRYTISNADNTWGFSVLDDRTWTDYRVKVNVQLEHSDEGMIAIVVRLGGSKYLVFRIVNIWMKGEWAFYDGNSFTSIAGLTSIGQSDQFDLEVDAIGNEFTAKINGMEIQRISLSGYEKGGVGLGISCFYPPCASFSNFQVSAP